MDDDRMTQMCIQYIKEYAEFSPEMKNLPKYKDAYNACVQHLSNQGLAPGKDRQLQMTPVPTPPQHPRHIPIKPGALEQFAKGGTVQPPKRPVPVVRPGTETTTLGTRGRSNDFDEIMNLFSS